jgi:hypothetical protein
MASGGSGGVGGGTLSPPLVVVVVTSLVVVAAVLVAAAAAAVVVAAVVVKEVEVEAIVTVGMYVDVRAVDRILGSGRGVLLDVAEDELPIGVVAADPEFESLGSFGEHAYLEINTNSYTPVAVSPMKLKVGSSADGSHVKDAIVLVPIASSP